jgi:transposase-like protein
VKAPRLTPAEKQEIVRLYTEEWLDVRTVAARVGRSYHVTWLTLSAAKVKMRPPGHQRGLIRQPSTTPLVPRSAHPAAPRVTDAEKAEMVRLYGLGKTLADVGKATGRAASTVARMLDEAGILTRRRGPTPHGMVTRHWCGDAIRHRPHRGCNGFGLLAGAPDELCPRTDRHEPHRSCDGRGAVT